MAHDRRIIFIRLSLILIEDTLLQFAEVRGFAPALSIAEVRFDLIG
jgi:hypothetical protein